MISYIILSKWKIQREFELHTYAKDDSDAETEDGNVHFEDNEEPMLEYDSDTEIEISDGSCDNNESCCSNVPEKKTVEIKTHVKDPDRHQCANEKSVS